MLLMLRLLTLSLLLSSSIYADTSDTVEDFLHTQFSKNTQLKSIDVTVDDVIPLNEVKGWSAYVVNIQAVLKAKPKELIQQKMIWFSNGDVITEKLTNLQTGDSLTDLIKPKFKAKYYTQEHLVYGNKNAKHKIAIFSDPLCPFCKAFVPAALKNMKKEPQKYAVYYFHLPLLRIHPASATVVRAAIAAELQGLKEVTLKMYNIKIKPNEKDVKKILTAFNKAVGSTLTVNDIQTKQVLQHLKFDMAASNDLMVAGTPTIYVDGKVDRTKNKYKEVK